MNHYVSFNGSYTGKSGKLAMCVTFGFCTLSPWQAHVIDIFFQIKISAAI